MFKKKVPPTYYNVKEIEATRAIYQEAVGVVPRVQIMILTDAGERLELDLDHLQVAKLIEQTMQAYNTIFPPLKTSRGGWGL
jgi:hypothetical protein